LNIQDFSLLDIIDPQSKRIKSILSVIINYMRLKDHEEESYKGLMVKNKEIEEKLAFKRSQYDKDKAEHDQLLEKKNREMPVIQERKKEIDVINEEIKVKKEVLNGLQAEEDGILKEKQSLEDHINGLRDKIDTLRQEIDNLQRRVVKGPEKIVETLNEVNNEVKSEKEAITALDEEINQLNLQLEIYNFLQQGLEECFKMMDDIRVGLNHDKNTKKKLKDAQRDVGQLRDLLEEKTKELQDIMKGIKINEERSENFEGQLQKRIEQIGSMLNQLQREKNNLQKDYEETQGTVRSLEKMKLDVEEQTKEVMQKNEQMVKETSEIYDEMLMSLQSLHSDLSYLFEACKQNTRPS